MGVSTWIDKAGPALASAVTMAVLAAAATTVVAVRSHIAASDVRFAGFESGLAALRADLDGFRAPGGRFTAHDGDRHWQRIEDIDRRLREQEQRPPRLNPGLEKAMDAVRDIENRVSVLETQLAHALAEQDRICQRVAGCPGRR